MNIDELNRKILASRRHYGSLELLENTAPDNPFNLFTHWFDDALNENNLDSCAMVLATIDEFAKPDTRVVLLLGLEAGNLYFYTSYNSAKGKQIANNNNAAINFYWPYKTRQVRLKGTIEKASRLESEKYFSSRDRGGQLAVYGKTQSSVIRSREDLNNAYAEAEKRFAGLDVPCPEIWGGYKFRPYYYEFFQGRDHRLHDRIAYSLSAEEWIKSRLAP